MALALDLTPQPLSTGASSSRSRTADASVQAHLLPALPSAPHVPLPSLSSPLPTPSSLASPSTPFPSGSAPSAVSAPLAAASRPCPSQPTTSRSEPSLPTPPASATNSWPSTPPPSSAHLTPGLLLCPPVDLTRCSSFSSFATDDSDAMDMSDFDIRELCGGDWQVSDDASVCVRAHSGTHNPRKRTHSAQTSLTLLPWLLPNHIACARADSSAAVSSSQGDRTASAGSVPCTFLVRHS